MILNLLLYYKKEVSMSYLILCDSCTDFTPQLRQDSHYKIIPLTLHIGRVADYPECARSSCPSPQHFMRWCQQADEIYMVTLSSQLSGSYNSAQLAREMILEQSPQKHIHVFDSKSASVGQTLIAMKINELAGKGLSFESVIKQTEKFVLETLENLRKNGRLSNLSAAIANALNIKPVMTSTPVGEIDKFSQARGMKRAIQKMAEAIAGDAVHPEEKTLGIAHCNNRERAEFTRDEILKLVPFKNIYITDTAGVSSLYAADGGIVVCY